MAFSAFLQSVTESSWFKLSILLADEVISGPLSPWERVRVSVSWAGGNSSPRICRTAPFSQTTSVPFVRRASSTTLATASCKAFSAFSESVRKSSRSMSPLSYLLYSSSGCCSSRSSSRTRGANALYNASSFSAIHKCCEAQSPRLAGSTSSRSEPIQ
jgi:hypothetical protein